MTGPDFFSDLAAENAHLQRRIQRRDDTIDIAYDRLSNGLIADALTYLKIAVETREAKR